MLTNLAKSAGGSLAPDSVLLTGAAGFVGVPTATELLNRGYSVVALDDFRTAGPERLERLADRGDLSVLQVDLTDPTAVSEAISGRRFSYVVHLAALHFIPYCIANPAETIAVNVLGTQHLLDSLALMPPCRLVFASTGDVYAPSADPHTEDDYVAPSNVYGQSKLMGEWLVRTFARHAPDCVASILRLFNIFGPGETNPHVLPDIFACMRRGDALSLGNLETYRDYVYVNDVARVISDLATGDSGAATLNVGGGNAATVAEMVSMLRDITGRPLEINIDHTKIRTSDRPILEADVSRLRRMLPQFEQTPRLEALTDTLTAEGLMSPQGACVP